MPARVILPEEIVASPDLTPVSGELDSIGFQDCMTIVAAFERLSHMSPTEESVFAPVSHMVQSTKYWAKSSQEVLGSRLLKSNIVESSTGRTIEIRSESPTSENTFESVLQSKNFSEALETIKDDCIPCDLRLKLALEALPSGDTLQIYLDDIKERIKMLSSIDKLLGDIEVFRDICPLLETLNIMCLPDLQRMIAILMASMMRVNVSLGDLNGLIVSLILPIIQPILSGVVNMLDQFALLVTNPIDCVTTALREQISRLPNFTTTSSDITGFTETAGSASASAQLANTKTTSSTQSLNIGLNELHDTLIDGRNYASSKLAFYIGVMKKALGDYTGDSQNYAKIAAAKLRTIQLIKLVVSIIELRRRGGKLCQPGTTPSQRELDNFFNNFLNPNSFVQINIDPDGIIRVEEPAEVLYQIEEPGEGAKILSIEPEGLLQKPAAMAFKCSFHTSSTDVEKINKWIKDLNKVPE